MNVNKKTMNLLFEVLDINSAKILLQGIEREKAIFSQRANTITSKIQAMVYLDEVLNENEVAVLEKYNSVTGITTTEVLNAEKQKKQRKYDLELFAKHKQIFNTAVRNHNWYKRLKYFLNRNECLTCKP